MTVALTGSIAMGKSTVAQMMRDEGIPVFDADAAVHELYREGGKAVEPLRNLFPTAIVDDAVDRARLATEVLNDKMRMAQLESIVHPMVHDLQDEFRNAARSTGELVVVFDIPLLFEGNRAPEFDAVIVVSAPAHEQRTRALARPGMTDEKLNAIIARQVPDADKRRRADFIISTGTSLDETRKAVKDVIAKLRAVMAGDR